jgi:hypothetical protein
LNLTYDWYQNVTHVFVSYKIKQGGEELKSGGLKVEFQSQAVTLENIANGEVLASIDLANSISEADSTYSCSARKVELKFKKVDESITWKGLEMGSGSTPTMMTSNTSGPAYPSSAKVKRDWSAVDSEMEKAMGKDDGDSALNGLFK